MNKALLTHLGSVIAGALILLCIPGVSKRLFNDKGTTLHLSTAPHKSTSSSVRPSDASPSSPSRKAPEEQPGKDSLEALLDIADIKIPSRSELESYLAAHNHPAEGYLAAGMILQDSGLMREALARDPTNPHILFALASRDEFPSADRIEWARQLREEQPQNSLASYLLASLTWNDRAKDSTLQSLAKVDSRQGFQSFTSESMVALNDALRATGCNPGGAALYATMAVDLPHLSSLLALSTQARLPPGKPSWQDKVMPPSARHLPAKEILFPSSLVFPSRIMPMRAFRRMPPCPSPESTRRHSNSPSSKAEIMPGNSPRQPNSSTPRQNWSRDTPRVRWFLVKLRPSGG